MTQPLPDPELSATTSEAVPSEDIQFYELLDAIHSQQNFHPQKNPVLGGIPIDLFKLYKLVKNAGGYQKVCVNKDWKHISLQFQLPSLPISSSVSFKHLYLRNLLAYEYVDTKKKTLEEVVKLSLEDLEAVGTSIDNYVDTVVMNDGVTVVRSAKRPRFEMPRPPVPPPAVTKFGAPKTLTKFAINPDDDGKDEKYVYGGWQNRLVLALRSQLPNEVDWAFNKLIRISYLHNFFVGFIPTLIEVLLEHAAPLFDKIALNTLPTHFEASLKDANSYDVAPFSDISFFNSEKIGVINERVLQSFHIIRNLSFHPDNQKAFSKDFDLLQILAKAVTLPSHTFYTEIKLNALDILENMIHLMPLRGQNDFFLSCLKVMLFDEDRAYIVGAIRCLNRITINEANEKIVQNIESSVIQRLLQLLLIPDEEIVLHVMEFFYLFTQASPDAGLRLLDCARFNVVRLLFKFLHWKGFQERMSKIQGKNAISKSTIVDPRAAEHFNAAMWLQTAFEPDPNYAITHSSMFAAYAEYCKKQGMKGVPGSELLKLVQKIYSMDAVGPSQTKGIKPRDGIHSMKGVVVLGGSNTPAKINAQLLKAKGIHNVGLKSPIMIGINPRNKENEPEKAISSSPATNLISSSSSMDVDNDADDNNSSRSMQIHEEDSTSEKKEDMKVDDAEETLPASKPLLPFVCLWDSDISTDTSSYSSFETVNELLQYTKTTFVDSQTGSGGRGFVCQWKGCHRKGVSKPYASAAQLFSHLLTHISSEPNIKAVLNDGEEDGLDDNDHAVRLIPKKSIPSSLAMAATNGTQGHVFPHPSEELRGIPLCALLILRNVSRHPANHVYFFPLESDLMGLMKNPKFNAIVGNILADLKH